MLAVSAYPAAKSFGIFAAEYPAGADDTVCVTIESTIEFVSHCDDLKKNVATYKLYAHYREPNILHHPKHFDICTTRNYRCLSTLQSL